MKVSARSGGRAAPWVPTRGNRVVRSLANLRAGLFLLLLALVAQGTAVQAHLHFAEQAQSLAVSPGEQAPASQPSERDIYAHCALCHQAATAGAYLLPPVTILASSPPATSLVATLAMVRFGLVGPALGWQSRAPPQ